MTSCYLFAEGNGEFFSPTNGVSTVDPRHVDAENLSAYDALAVEYDSIHHSTTRVLEALSNRAVCEMVSRQRVDLSKSKIILELGAGTGSLTSQLLRLGVSPFALVASDLSPAMRKAALERIAREFPGKPAPAYRVASVLSTPLSTIGKAEVVFAGLADPYFLCEGLSNVRSVCNGPESLFIFTLPDAAWAAEERSERLKIPIERTQFRLFSGQIVSPFSFTYSLDEMDSLLRASDLQLVESRRYSELGVQTSSVAPSILAGVAKPK